jgi:bifunctional ADP-heptose synthase (sugar kinase/adenylyltransferase)
MKVSEKNQYTLIKLQESSLIEFKKRFDEINSNHIIVILSEDFNMNEKNISFFLEVTKIQKTNNKSFVVVKNGIEIDKISELLNITPTLVEAEDILEIEAIERDLFK